jgi:syringate O-demethylase
VTCTYDERTVVRPDPQNRRHFRYQIQGPNSAKVIAAATGREAPELKFFHMCWMTIAGKRVRALRHGMAGQPGYELMGPWQEGAAVHAALVEAGAKHGMRLVGGRCYSSNALESAWIPSPLPAVYTGKEMRPYREWLTANHYEAKASIGGSFVADDIQAYYLTPWDLGYGPFVKFDHEFTGRAALEKRASGPHRRKVTLALDNVSVTDALFTMFDDGLRAKFMEFPSAVYAMHPFDSVMADGKLVGLSTWIGYSANEGKMLTLAMVDEAYAASGKEVTLIWGEPDGGTAKPAVERHRQVEIKAVVSPAPYSKVARTTYADSWRNRPR